MFCQKYHIIEICNFHFLITAKERERKRGLEGGGVKGGEKGRRRTNRERERDLGREGTVFNFFLNNIR